MRRLRYVEGLRSCVRGRPRADASAGRRGGGEARRQGSGDLGRGVDHDNVRSTCGLVRSVEHLDQGDGMSLDCPLLRVTIVPRVWLTSLARRTRPFVDRSIDDVITQVRSEVGLSIAGTASTGEPALVGHAGDRHGADVPAAGGHRGHPLRRALGKRATPGRSCRRPATTRSRPRRRPPGPRSSEGSPTTRASCARGRIDAMAPRTPAVADIGLPRRGALKGGLRLATEGRVGPAGASRPGSGAEDSSLPRPRSAPRTSDARSRSASGWRPATAQLGLRASLSQLSSCPAGSLEKNVKADQLVARVEHEVETDEDGGKK
ncbi:MAG: hypothetical protein IPF99_30900 [Deltaproteobacteria bacterium]|nr:hypothetical protein [Deltaproteobacteria bacterium]